MKKDMKKVEKRHYDLSLFAEIVGKLANGLPLDEKYCDHALEGNWKNHRECHIKPDWLLVYQAQFRVLNFSVIIGLDPIIHWKDC